MAKLTKETIQWLTELSRIHCDAEEKEALFKDLQGILAYFDQLDEVTTSDVPPCNHVLGDMAPALRDDVVGETLPRETFLSLAPEQVSGLVRVPPIIKKQPR